MPKKTRKEKILALQRNRTKKFESFTVEENSPEITPVAKATKPQNSINSQALQEEKLIRQYFISDLRKSLLIIGAVFALEFFFYFATMSNYLKFSF